MGGLRIKPARLAFIVSLVNIASVLLSPIYADEGGVSYWLPGQYASLAAVPAEPGWSMPLVYYHAPTDAGGSKEFLRGGTVRLGLDVSADLLLASPTYVFADPVWGGQMTLSMTGIFGRAKVAADVTLTGPGGEVLSGSVSDSLTSVGDLYPSASVRWNNGVHSTMVYASAGVPVGSYKADRLVNIGTNHWSLDAGGGYTYLDMQTGREFSATAGLTYNFENPDTDYQNGIAAHVDWGASQFLSEQWHVGLVGYFYYQITGDSGAGAVLGDFKSSVSAIGPQVGYLFEMDGRQAYLNLKAYSEFDAKNRPEGWNAWLILAMSF
jgi:hypothetical protein